MFLKVGFLFNRKKTKDPKASLFSFQKGLFIKEMTSIIFLEADTFVCP